MNFLPLAGLYRRRRNMINAQAIATPLETTLMSDKSTDLSRTRLWAGGILTGLSAAFFIMDGGMKLFEPPFVVQPTVQLGFPESTIVGIGAALLVCTLLYL